MTWVAVGGAAVTAAGSAYSSNQNKKAAGAAGAASIEGAKKDWQHKLEGNKINLDNQVWAQGINQKAADQALGQNRIDQTSDFGSVDWNQDPATGEWSQKASVTPEQQAMLGSLRGQQATAIGGMESGFNVNNDVMQAMRAQSVPIMEQQRNKENARLAAMGLGTGSGSAWGQSQDVLNRSDNDMEQKNILGGFSAWNQEQANNRSNLGALNATETGWRQNMSPLAFQSGQTAQTVGVDAPNFGGNSDMQGAAEYGADMNVGANAANQAGWAGVGKSAAGALPAMADWWNQPGTGTGAPPAGASQGSTSTGFDLGSELGKNSMSGFYTNPWGTT